MNWKEAMRQDEAKERLRDKRRQEDEYRNRDLYSQKDLDDAVAEEREACAKAAEKVAEELDKVQVVSGYHLAKIAAAIRARK